MQKLTFLQKWPITPTLSKSWHIFPNYAQLTPQQAKEHSAKMYVFPEIVNHVDHSLSCIAKIVLFDKKTVFFGGCIQHYSSEIEAFFRQRPQVDNEKKPRLRGSVKGDNSAQNAKLIPNDKFVPEWEIQSRMSKSSLNEEDIPELPIELRITKWAFRPVFVILFT